LPELRRIVDAALNLGALDTTRRFVVGCDYSTYEAVFVGLPFPRPSLSDQPVVETVVFRPKKKNSRDDVLPAMKAARMALLQSKLYYQASIFWIERGFGASRQSDFKLGAFFGIIVSTCSAQAETNEIQAGEWKREISGSCGLMTKQGHRGNYSLKKDEAHIYVRQVAIRAGHDISGYGPDALDAYAIATTGRWLNERALEKISQ